MGPTIAFMAGASARRGWRYVQPCLPDGTTPLFHELIGNDTVDPGYSWSDEVEALGGLLPVARRAHLVGFSAGGTLALAFVAAAPERVASLCLVEPAWSFLPLTEVEAEYYRELDAAMRLPARDQHEAFRRLLVRPGVPLGESPAEIVAENVAREAAGRRTSLRIVTDAMERHVIDPRAFAQFDGRVYIAIGGRSHPMWRDQAAALDGAFRDSRVEVFEERHHLDAPQKTETKRLVGGLRWAWAGSGA